MIKRFVLSIALCIVAGIAGAEEFIADGKANGIIVIPAQPSKVAKFAAEELQTFLKQMTRVDVPVAEMRISTETPAVSLELSAKRRISSSNTNPIS